MPLDPLLRESATALARRIAGGELSSRQVVDAHIEHALRVGPTVNAIAHDRFDAARGEADLADRQLRHLGPAGVGPFHGVPVTVKECLGVAGLRQTAGLVSRRHTLARVDATSAARLRAAGAIPIGVTNVSELMMWMETDNKIYGRTNNPYDPTRTVGGSSGGEGAIVGAGASPLGLGSDIGGSIRMPAFFNGVFGHKPSAGLIPNTGHWPMSENAARRYLCTGPLCRRAEDLWPALRVLAGPDGADPACAPMTLGDPAAVALAGLKVYDVPTRGPFTIAPALAEAQRRAAAALAACGATVERYDHPRLRQAFSIWSTLMHDASSVRFADLMSDGEGLRILRELGALVRGRSTHTFPAFALAATERLIELVPGRERVVAAAAALKRDIDALLDDRAVLLYPSYPETAPRHGRALLPPLKWQYAAIWNVLELPVTQVPLGLGPDGLPLGIQVVAGHGRDHLTVAVALELERRFGGWTPPAVCA